MQPELTEGIERLLRAHFMDFEKSGTHRIETLWSGFNSGTFSYPQGRGEVALEPETDVSSSVRVYALDAFSFTVLSKQVEALQKEVKRLGDMFASRPLFYSGQLFDLADDRFLIGVPIPTVLEEYEEEALARWADVSASGVGATLADAIESLKADIVDLFTDLSSRDSETLSEPAKRTLATLRLHVFHQE